jgi:hypothetical protein
MRPRDPRAQLPGEPAHRYLRQSKLEKSKEPSEADPIGTRKQAYRESADPTFETYGPKTDSEYDALIAGRGGFRPELYG